MFAAVRTFLPFVRLLFGRRAFLLIFAVSFSLWQAPTYGCAQDAAQNDACAASVSSSACDQPLPVRNEVPAYAGRIYRVAVDMHAGVAGIGTEVAVPLTDRFELRAGSDFFSYSTVVYGGEDPINLDVRLRSAKLAMDWYVTHHHALRVSPLLVFANSTRAALSLNLNAGQSVTLNDAIYFNDPADPLHGNASIELRRMSPGFSMGFGHMIPERGHHFSFPFEAGFYYAGAPAYKMQFGGNACSNQESGLVVCQPVQNDPAFQYNLAQFKAKYQGYVNDARFFPVLSSGVSFAF